MAEFEWITGRQLLYQPMGTRVLVDSSGIDEEVTATLRLAAWWHDRIAVTTAEYRFQFVLGPDERVCIIPAPVDVKAELRAEAEQIKQELADHDPAEFTRRLMERIEREAD